MLPATSCLRAKKEVEVRRFQSRPDNFVLVLCFIRGRSFPHNCFSQDGDQSGRILKLDRFRAVRSALLSFFTRVLSFPRLLYPEWIRIVDLEYAENTNDFLCLKVLI